MIYVGIDIAKTNHYASIVNYSTGEVFSYKLKKKVRPMDGPFLLHSF